MNSLCCVCSLCLPSFLSLFPLLLRLLFLPSLYYFSHFPLYSPWYLLSTCIIFSPSLTPLSFFSYLFCLYPHDFYLRPRQLLNCPEKLLSKKNEEPAINCTIFLGPLLLLAVGCCDECHWSHGLRLWLCGWRQAGHRQALRFFCPLSRLWPQGKLLLTQNHRAKRCPLLPAHRKETHCVFFVSAHSLYLHMWLVYFWQQLQLSPSRLHRKAGWCYSSATVCKKTRSNQSKRYNNISNMTFKSPYRTHQPCSTY